MPAASSTWELLICIDAFPPIVTLVHRISIVPFTRSEPSLEFRKPPIKASGKNCQRPEIEFELPEEMLKCEVLRTRSPRRNSALCQKQKFTSQETRIEVLEATMGKEKVPKHRVPT